MKTLPVNTSWNVLAGGLNFGEALRNIRGGVSRHATFYSAAAFRGKFIYLDSIITREGRFLKLRVTYVILFICFEIYCQYRSNKSPNRRGI